MFVLLTDMLSTPIEKFTLPAFHVAVEQAAIPSSAWEQKDAFALVTAVTGIVALVASIVTSARTLAAARRTAEATLWQKSNEAEQKQIEDRLRSFYAPLT